MIARESTCCDKARITTEEGGKEEKNRRLNEGAKVKMSEGLKKKVRSARITCNKLCATGSRGIALDWRERRWVRGGRRRRRGQEKKVT